MSLWHVCLHVLHTQATLTLQPLHAICDVALEFWDGQEQALKLHLEFRAVEMVVVGHGEHPPLSATTPGSSSSERPAG